MAKTCCPTGKVFDVLSGLCMTLNHLEPEEPIECPCCRVGATYDSLSGMCIDISGAQTVTVECPCCPAGYTFVNIAIPGYPSGYCEGINASDTTSTIPCLPCNCEEPVDPPPCDTCSGGTLPITFTFNQDTKNCTSCNQQGEPNLAPFKSFIADKLIAPLINFLRR